MFGRTHDSSDQTQFTTSTLNSSASYGFHGSDDGGRRCMPLLRDMSYEELPEADGFRSLPDVCDLGGASSEDDGSELRVRPAQYGGSFTVAGTDQATRSEYVRSTIHKLQVPTSGTKPVLLVVSLDGIKVCSPEGKQILRRPQFSFSTCGRRTTYLVSQLDPRQQESSHAGPGRAGPGQTVRVAR